MSETMDREIPVGDRWRQTLRSVAMVLLAVLVAGVVLRFGIGLLAPSVKLSRVRVGTVDRGSLEAVLEGAGTVVPDEEQAITSLVQARLLRVLRQPGSRVEVGDAIVELDVAEATLALGRFEDQIRELESQRRELEVRLTERLFELESQVELRKLDIEELVFNVEQDTRLFEEGLISETQLRATRLRQRKAGIELEQLEESVASHRESTAAQLEAQDARLQTLERQFADATAKVGMATLRADRAGVLTYVFNRLGATIPPGETLARIADPNRFRIEASIPEVHAERLTENLEVRVPIGSQSLTGRISSIEPAVTQGSVRFHVALDEPDHPALRPNLRIEVLVVTDFRDSVLRVGKGPFVSGTGPNQVFVVEGDRAYRRDVRLGLSGHRQWEVIEGLEEGESVILSDMNRHLGRERVKVR